MNNMPRIFFRNVPFENFLRILAVHLHNNGILAAWKCKPLKTCFIVQALENNTVITFNFCFQ